MSPVYVVVTWVAFVAMSFARPSAADTYSSAQLHGLRHIKVAVSMWDRSETPAFEPSGEWEQFERNARLRVAHLLNRKVSPLPPLRGITALLKVHSRFWCAWPTVEWTPRRRSTPSQ